MGCGIPRWTAAGRPPSRVIERRVERDAASIAQDDARSAAQDVSGRAQEAKDSVQDHEPRPSDSGRSNPPPSPGDELPYGTS